VSSAPIPSLAPVIITVLSFSRSDANCSFIFAGQFWAYSIMLIVVEGCLFLLFCETFASVNNIVGREITIETASSPERVISHSSHFDDF